MYEELFGSIGREFVYGINLKLWDEFIMGIREAFEGDEHVCMVMDKACGGLPSFEEENFLQICL